MRVKYTLLCKGCYRFRSAQWKIYFHKGKQRLNCKKYLEILVDSYAPIPWSLQVYKQQKPKPHLGWYATAFYRMWRKLGLWSNGTGLVAWETAGSILSKVTGSLTLDSQRAETKDHITTQASVLTSGKYTGPRVNNELGLADYMLPQEEMKRNRTGMDKCPWEKKSISSHTNHCALSDWLRQKSGSKKRNWRKRKIADNPLPSHSLTFRWGNKTLLSDVSCDDINYLSSINKKELIHMIISIRPL